jgi:uncharacterized protein YktB (UPF0637 family)
MEEKIISMASNNGLWAVLFVVLLFYILNEQKKRDEKAELRESKYQEIISKLTEKFNLVEAVKEDVKEIKDHIFR